MRRAALALLLALGACHSSKPRPPFPPVVPPIAQGCGAGWTVNPLVSGVAYGPTSCSPDGRRLTGPLPYGATISVEFEIAGASTFVGAQEQGSFAYVSLFIQRAGDNWSGLGAFNEFRAYSVGVVPAAENLGNGRFVLSQQLVREQWVAVMDGGTEQGFRELLQNAERVGITFGTAQSGRAHGVCSGNASTQFIMHGFTIN